MELMDKNYHIKNTEIARTQQPLLPGSRILQLMFAHGIEFQKDLAMMLGLSPSTMNKIIKGKLQITAEVAIRLASLFPNHTADQWMTWQANLDLADAKTSGIESKIKQEIYENKKRGMQRKMPVKLLPAKNI